MCVEKYFKARLQEAGISIPFTHNLVLLITLLAPVEPMWSTYSAFAQNLTQHAVRTRYPGSHVTAAEAKEMVKRCREIRAVVRQALGLKT